MFAFVRIRSDISQYLQGLHRFPAGPDGMSFRATQTAFICTQTSFALTHRIQDYRTSFVACASQLLTSSPVSIECTQMIVACSPRRREALPMTGRVCKGLLRCRHPTVLAGIFIGIATFYTPLRPMYHYLYSSIFKNYKFYYHD